MQSFKILDLQVEVCTYIKKTDCTCMKKAQIFSLVFCDFLDPWYYDCGCLGTLKTACIGQHFDSLKKEEWNRKGTLVRWKGYVNFTYVILEVASLREVEFLRWLQILIYC